jgi:hypothetical protein
MSLAKIVGNRDTSDGGQHIPLKDVTRDFNGLPYP